MLGVGWELRNGFGRGVGVLSRFNMGLLEDTGAPSVKRVACELSLGFNAHKTAGRQ